MVNRNRRNPYMKYEQENQEETFATKDDAVSPVIAVILMVAITVVLAATVYVWISGFNSEPRTTSFPQVTVVDDSAELSSDTEDNLVQLKHRGGGAIDWSNFKVLIDGNESRISQPIGEFRVGNSVTLTELGTNIDSGLHEIQVIDTKNELILLVLDIDIR